MRCGACGQEVALAKVCPYCGSKVEHGGDEEGASDQGPRGTFRGRVDDGPRPTGSLHGSFFPGVSQVIRFLLEPRIAPVKKSLFLLALFYLLSPIDLLPGLFAPVVGWLDDLAVVALALRYVATQLDKVDRT